MSLVRATWMHFLFAMSPVRTSRFSGVCGVVLFYLHVACFTLYIWCCRPSLAVCSFEGDDPFSAPPECDNSSALPLASGGTSFLTAEDDWLSQAQNVRHHMLSPMPTNSPCWGSLCLLVSFLSEPNIHWLTLEAQSCHTVLFSDCFNP